MKVLLFFHGGSDNRGCEAIARTATNLLRTDSRIQKLALSSTNPESDKVIPHSHTIHFTNCASLKAVKLRSYFFDYTQRIFNRHINMFQSKVSKCL